MKKGILIIIAAVTLATGSATLAFATSTYTDIVDFEGEVDDIDGVDFTYVEPTNTFSYNHILSGLTTPPHILLSGNLSISHMGVSSNEAAEVWLAYAASGNKEFLGKLSPSPYFNGWQKDSFDVNSSVLEMLDDSTPWTLVISLEEQTSGTDKIRLDYSQLRVEYETSAVPIPGSLVLLGSGLGALTFLRRA